MEEVMAKSKAFKAAKQQQREADPTVEHSEQSVVSCAFNPPDLVIDDPVLISLYIILMLANR